jgi:hypothetical protein
VCELWEEYLALFSELSCETQREAMTVFPETAFDAVSGQVIRNSQSAIRNSGFLTVGQKPGLRPTWRNNLPVGRLLLAVAFAMTGRSARPTPVDLNRAAA